MKMRCDRAFWDYYFTRGRDGVSAWKLEAYRTSVIFVVGMICRIFLHIPQHIYSFCLWSLRLLVRNYVKCNVLYNVVYNWSNEWVMAQVYELS